MNHTEAYLMRLRSNCFRRLAVCSFGYLAVSFLGCAISFLAFRSSDSALCWAIASPTASSGVWDRLGNALAGQAIPSLYAAILMLSAFTLFCIPAAVALCLLRGASLGCFGALFRGGRLSVPCALPLSGVTAYLTANAAFCFLAALAAVYSDAIHHAYWAGESRYASSLVWEYFRSYSVSAGIFFLAGMTAQILLT